MDINDLQPDPPFQQIQPLLSRPLPRCEGRQHRHVELRRVPVDALVREDHLVDQDDGLSPHCVDSVFQDRLAGLVRVVVEDVAEVVESGVLRGVFSMGVGDKKRMRESEI